MQRPTNRVLGWMIVAVIVAGVAFVSALNLSAQDSKFFTGVAVICGPLALLLTVHLLTGKQQDPKS